MYEVAPEVFLLKCTPNYLINVYLIGDVLLDAGTRMAQQGLLRQLKGRTLSAHILTHVHPDHQGASSAVCTHFHVPLWCGSGDATAMETGDMHAQIPRHAITRLQDVFWTGPGYPVDKALHEGDEVAGFTVIETPGHSPGHVSYWREKDKVLILGDVATNLDFLTMRTRLGEPPRMFTLDIQQNRRSCLKLADLNPRLVLFGHGKPLLDGAQFTEFAQRLASQMPDR